MIIVNRQKEAVVSTKERHILQFWYTKLSELECDQGGAVSSGELARYVGQSIGTAKRYLNRLVGEGAAGYTTVVFPNGVEGKKYNAI